MEQEDDSLLVSLANSYDDEPDIIEIDHWDAPEENDVRILTAPNQPYPIHGQCPRTLLGSHTWNAMRRYCYEQSEDTCEVCGFHPDDNRKRHAHEIMSIDYTTQTAIYKRTICLCSKCHLQCIHTGRALTMYKKNSPLMVKEMLLDGAEHAYSLIAKWNSEHLDDAPLRLFSTWLDYEKYPELKDRMVELRKQYGIKFYKVSNSWYDEDHWSNWKLVISGKAYPTPYKNHAEWELAMEKNNLKRKGELTTPFSGKVYNELDKFLKED